MGTDERRRQFEPVSVRQPDVDEDSIRREPLGGIHGRRRAVGIADDGVTTPLEQFARDLPEHGHVVDDEDANWQRSIVGAPATLVKLYSGIATSACVVLS